jgi:hypothetical protein
MSSPLRKDCQADLYALMEKLPKQDPAWNLLDAFDAVTNGMENPEAMKKTELLSNAELEPWKFLIKAIASLYTGNSEGCRKAVEAIQDNSAPGSLKPLFRAWLIRQNTGNAESGDALFEELTNCCDSVTELFRRLIIEPHPLSLVAEQAEEALRQGLEEQFSNLSVKVLCSLKEASPFLAFRYTVYCLNLVNDSGADGQGFFPLIQKYLGEGDAFCALGFVLTGKDNKAASVALNNGLKNVPPLSGTSGRKLSEPDKTFLGGKNTASVQVLAKLLKDMGGGTRQKVRRRAAFSQPELFLNTPQEELHPISMDNAVFKEKLFLSLREQLSREDFLLLEKALCIPVSFDELARELPPAARYLGPGCWIKAIKDSFNPL